MNLHCWVLFSVTFPKSVSRYILSLSYFHLSQRHTDISNSIRVPSSSTCGFCIRFVKSLLHTQCCKHCYVVLAQSVTEMSFPWWGGWSSNDSDAWVGNVCQVEFKCPPVSLTSDTSVCTLLFFSSSVHVTIMACCHSCMHHMLSNHLQQFCYILFGPYLVSIPMSVSTCDLVDAFFWLILQCCESPYSRPKCCEPRRVCIT